MVCVTTKSCSLACVSAHQTWPVLESKRATSTHYRRKRSSAMFRACHEWLHVGKKDLEKKTCSKSSYNLYSFYSSLWVYLATKPCWNKAISAISEEVEGKNKHSHSPWNTFCSCRPNTADQKSLSKLTISNCGCCKSLSCYLCKWLINWSFTMTM